MFQTDRLLVRHLGADDAGVMHSVYGDAEVVRYVGDAEPLGRDGCAGWVVVTEKNYATRGYGMSALVLKETGEVIGFCGLVHPGGQVEPEIKYALAKQYWGRGYATEAVSGMLAYGAEEFGLTEVIATVSPDNAASLNVLAKAGLSVRETRLEDDGSQTVVLAWRP